MRLSFVLFVIAATVLASSDAVSMATTSGDLVANSVKSDGADGKRFLRSTSTVNDVDDQDEERVLDVLRLFRGKRGDFDDPNLTAQFDEIMTWFKAWKGKSDDEITAAIREVVKKDKNRKNLQTMYDMYKADGEKKLHAKLVKESKQLNGGRRS